MSITFSLCCVGGPGAAVWLPMAWPALGVEFSLLPTLRGLPAAAEGAFTPASPVVLAGVAARQGGLSLSIQVGSVAERCRMLGDESHKPPSSLRSFIDLRFQKRQWNNMSADGQATFSRVKEIL